MSKLNGFQLYREITKIEKKVSIFYDRRHNVLWCIYGHIQ
jgi:hypothetical protein